MLAKQAVLRQVQKPGEIDLPLPAPSSCPIHPFQRRLSVEHALPPLLQPGRWLIPTRDSAIGFAFLKSSFGHEDRRQGDHCLSYFSQDSAWYGKDPCGRYLKLHESCFREIIRPGGQGL